MLLPFGRGGLPFGAEQRRRLHADLGRVDAEVGEHASGYAFALADQAEQQVLGADVVMVELARLFEGELDHALGARREDHLLLNGLAAAADDGLDFLADFARLTPSDSSTFAARLSPSEIIPSRICSVPI